MRTVTELVQGFTDHLRGVDESLVRLTDLVAFFYSLPGDDRASVLSDFQGGTSDLIDSLSERLSDKYPYIHTRD